MKMYHMRLELADEHGNIISDKDRIGLAEAKRSIMRKVVVPGSMKLSELHFLIQRAFGWRNLHLHKFVLKKRDFDRLCMGDFKMLAKLSGSLLSSFDRDNFRWHRHRLIRDYLLPADVFHVEDSFYLGQMRAAEFLNDYMAMPEDYSMKKQELIYSCNVLNESLKTDELFINKRASGGYMDYSYEHRKEWKRHTSKEADLNIRKIKSFKDAGSAEFFKMDEAINRYLECRKNYIAAVENEKSSSLTHDENDMNHDMGQNVHEGYDKSRLKNELIEAALKAGSMTQAFEPVIEPFFDSIEYRYDVGDSWCVNIDCEEIADEEVTGFSYIPRITAADGMNLMEEVGGEKGYFELLRSILSGEESESELLKEMAALYGLNMKIPDI